MKVGFNMKGGYKILDFNGYTFSTSTTSAPKSTIIDGIYERIEGSDKAFLIEGYNLDGVEYKAFFTAFVVTGGSFVTIFNNHYITISANDKIVVTAVTTG